MSFFLALDVGGTKTDYVLADETRELERVRTGTIKRMRTDAVTATKNLEQALSELTAKTGVSMQSMTRTCVGTAGVTVPLVAFERVAVPPIKRAPPVDQVTSPRLSRVRSVRVRLAAPVKRSLAPDCT